MIAMGQVSWFNPAKRFGFVRLADGLGDAFLHFNVLKEGGYYRVPRGTTVEVQVENGAGNRQEVVEVLRVDLTTAKPGEWPAQPRKPKTGATG